MALGVFNIKDYGAKGDGVTDDTSAFKNAFAALKNIDGGHLVIPQGYTFNISSTIYITGLVNATIDGGGIINWVGASSSNDIINFQGNAKSGSECKNILIKDLTFNNAARFGIQIYGGGFTYSPHNIVIQNITTNNNTQGGIYINKAYDIEVINCKNIGGYRHVGVGATKNFKDVYNIQIKGCSTSKTTRYGYQSYYGSNISIIDCKVDGTQITSGDKSCITIDRSKNVTVENNVVQNAYQNIFITGVQEVSCTGNTTYGGTYGIQVFYNNESQEDSIIKEAYKVNVTENSVKNASLVGIIFNGVIQSSISNNIITGVPIGKTGIHLMYSIRARDNVEMQLKQIEVSRNFLDGDIYIKASKDAGITLIDNQVSIIRNVIS